MAAELLLANTIDVPPVGAAPDNVTVPVEVFPPSTVAGARLIETNVAGMMVKVAVNG
jgi:hypothetical protein